MPHKDAASAVELILKYFPRAPFWPQLPKRDFREGMVAQFSENVPCLRAAADGVFLDTRDKDRELEEFYDRIIAGDTGYFKIGLEYAAGLYNFYSALRARGVKGIEFIKCHITGPFTFAAGISNKDGAALLHDEILMQAAVKALEMKALWQLNLFRQFGKKMILFIDEPYLAAFGSAFTPVNRDDVVAQLRELTSALEAPDVLIGLHCCGNTDWSMLTEVSGIDIISFDAFSFSDKFALYAPDLQKFLARGGDVCWGMVPTQDCAVFPDAGSLLEKIEGGIKNLVKKGVNEDLARNNLLLSPSCGLGTLNEAKAERIFSLLAEVSRAYQGQ